MSASTSAAAPASPAPAEPALMTRPELVMIDELSLGLAPTIVAQLLDVVREIHRRGSTIVIVEQSVNVALQLAQRAVFMEKGEVRFEGPAAELLERPDILRAVFIQGASAHEGAAGNGHKANGRGKRGRTVKATAEAEAKAVVDAVKVLDRREDRKAFIVRLDVFCAGIERREGKVFLVHLPGWHDKLADMFELPGNGSIFS